VIYNQNTPAPKSRRRHTFECYSNLSFQSFQVPFVLATMSAPEVRIDIHSAAYILSLADMYLLFIRPFFVRSHCWRRTQKCICALLWNARGKRHRTACSKAYSTGIASIRDLGEYLDKDNDRRTLTYIRTVNGERNTTVRDDLGDESRCSLSRREPRFAKMVRAAGECDPGEKE
jgi:hypothetical protein